MRNVFASIENPELEESTPRVDVPLVENVVLENAPPPTPIIEVKVVRPVCRPKKPPAPPVAEALMHLLSRMKRQRDEDPVSNQQ